MTNKEKEKYIKSAFKEYNKNKKRLKEISFDDLRGVDYTRQRNKNATPTGSENAIVDYLDEKQEFEKKVAIVDKCLWYYQLAGTGKDE